MKRLMIGYFRSFFAQRRPAGTVVGVQFQSPRRVLFAVESGAVYCHVHQAGDSVGQPLLPGSTGVCRRKITEIKGISWGICGNLVERWIGTFPKGEGSSTRAN